MAEPRFPKYQRNLNDWYHALPQTGVFILYFLARDLSKPLIRDRFRQWMVGDTPVYLMTGQQDKTGLFNYLYVYTPTSTKLISHPLHNMPDPYDPNEGIIYSAVVEGRAPEHPIHLSESAITSYLGDHIDFAIIANRNPPGVLVKTHSTSYTLDDDTMQFHRTQNDCNFVIPDKVLRAPAMSSLLCENPKVKGRPVTNFYSDALEQNVIHGLLERLFDPWVANGVGGGDAMEIAMYTYDNRGARHRIHVGKRQGLYWLTANGRKRYMKNVRKGGQPPAASTATGVEEALGDVIPMISELLFEPIKAARPLEFEGVRVFFDTGREWGMNMNEWLVVMYDFVHRTHVSYVNMDIVMKARHAYRRTQAEMPRAVADSEDAAKCLSDFRRRAAEVVAKMAEVH